MIPRTYPSVFANNGQQQMVIFLLTSVEGLQKFVDYIPIKFVVDTSNTLENTYENKGYINVTLLSSLSSNSVAFKDYVPCFVDPTATDAWTTNIAGYIPAGVKDEYISSLFASNEQGAWYDPSDMNTLFQDAAGTTPVTAVEQPVGRMLDKSGRGNHATQTTAASRPVLSARYNLLTKTEDFSDTAWTAGKSAGASVTPNNTIAPNGTLTADTVTFASSADYLYYGFVNYPAISGNSVTLTYHSKTTTRLFIFGGASPSGSDVHGYVDVGGGWYRHTTVRTFTATTSAQTLQVMPSSFFAGAGSYPIWGAQLTVTNSLPDNRYQRVNTATDYDTVCFRPYLRFDGVDDFLVTPSINFTGTDKMTVFAGIRKLSDAASGIVSEISASADANSGTFYLAAPAGASTNYQMQTGAVGARVFTSYSAYAAPITNVVASQINNQAVGALKIVTKINGATVAGSPIVDGAGASGNFGNYPLYIGRRGGTSLPFNGHLYSLIIRGAQSSDAQIRGTEAWVNSKTGAY